jgi:hypothetical protein
LTIFYLDSAGFAEFMKAGDEDNGTHTTKTA